MRAFVHPDILRMDIPEGEKLLFIVLVSRAGKGKECWPSQVQLAADCSCSIRSVSTRVRNLARRKLIDCRYFTRGGLTLLRYVVLDTAWPAAQEPDSQQGSNKHVPRAPKAPSALPAPSAPAVDRAAEFQKLSSFEKSGIEGAAFAFKEFANSKKPHERRWAELAVYYGLEIR